jgi:Fe-S-cluster containining protein
MKLPESPIRFECLADCSNCCETADSFVFLTDREADAIADFLKLDSEHFKEWFTRLVDDQLILKDGEQGHCLFLEEGQCLIYETRPAQCRSFPFWPENMRSKARWRQTKEICPGIGQGSVYSPQEIQAILNGKSLDSRR